MAESSPDTIAVQAQSHFDTAALQRYLKTHVGGFDKLHIEQFRGGQSNPTYLLDTGDQRFVLRKKPSGPLLASAHAIEREYRVIDALQNTDVPVARTVCLCEDADVIGTPFYVMSFVAGRIFWDPTLPGMNAHDRAALYDDVNRTVAALHQVDWRAVGLEGFGRPGDYLARQIARWCRQIEGSRTVPIEALDRLMAWLPSRIPSGETTTIVHGDLRMDNLIIHPIEPRILAVLDWELSTLGDPLADLSYHMLTWLLRSDEFRGMAEADLPKLGIPSAEQYLGRYCERTGRAPVAREVWDFHIVYNLFRLAAILQGIARREQDGTASNATAAETGAKARPIADLAWRLAQERLGAR